MARHLNKVPCVQEERLDKNVPKYRRSTGGLCSQEDFGDTVEQGKRKEKINKLKKKGVKENDIDEI